jgi:hypothetical protein
MTHSNLTIQMTVLVLFVAPCIDAQENTALFGKVTTAKKTFLKSEPTASAVGTVTLPANTDLRWIMGQQKDIYLRVMVPKGPSGWVLQSEVTKVQNADLSSIALAGTAQPCVSPETLDACTTTKPTGCSDPDSPHGLANRLKRTVPPEGDALLLTFETFSQLQSEAVRLVDQGVDIAPADRDQIKSIETSAGTVGEGSRVRLMAFLSDGTPHPNTGESVNCNLKTEANNDIHIPVSESKNASEFEAIVVEMIPQNRPAKWNSANVKKLRGKLLLIEGGLFYDNLHFANGDAANPVPNQPKRFSLWEIHPVVSLKVCKNADGRCDPNRDSDWQDF